jgi:hypothetical protein
MGQGATLDGSEDLASGAPDTRRRKPKHETSDEEYRGMMMRLVRRYEGRIEESGLTPLADLVAIRDYIEVVISAGVASCRQRQDPPASWADIAEVTHLSRSAAQERWRYLAGARRPGGQRADWRSRSHAND